MRAFQPKRYSSNTVNALQPHNFSYSGLQTLLLSILEVRKIFSVHEISKRKMAPRSSEGKPGTADAFEGLSMLKYAAAIGKPNTQGDKFFGIKRKAFRTVPNYQLISQIAQLIS